MTGEPCFGLRDGVIAEVLTVRYRHALTQLAENIICQLVCGIRHGDRAHLTLHLDQLLQRDRRGNLAEDAVLLIFENGKAGISVLDVGRHDFQLQTVIQRLQDLLLWVAEIGYLIGRREKGDRGDGICMAFIGVLALVERSQERVEHAVIALEYLVEQHDVRLRDLAGRLYDRLTAMQQGHGLSVCLQLVRRLAQHGEGLGRILPLPQTVYRTLQIKAQVLVHIIVLQRGVRDAAGDQAG